MELQFFKSDRRGLKINSRFRLVAKLEASACPRPSPLRAHDLECVGWAVLPLYPKMNSQGLPVCNGPVGVGLNDHSS